MESEVIKLALTQGIFCALFIWLFIDTRKDGKKREESYQVTIKDNQAVIVAMTENLSIVKEIKIDIDGIKDKMFGQN